MTWGEPELTVQPAYTLAEETLCVMSCVSLSHWLALILGSISYRFSSGDSLAIVCPVLSEVSLVSLRPLWSVLHAG